MTETIFLGLGSNLDKPIRQIYRAIGSLGEFVDSIERANLYRSNPLGPQDQPDFINTVIKGRTSLTPEDLLGFVKRIERYQQRVETIRWGPRTIDIDILYFGNLNFNSSSLKIPHPEILKRSFVAIPLLDLLTNAITPTGDRIDRNRYDASTLVRIETQEEIQWL
ncbi:MAG: 2-amino-4-hydroxy-6-hydroxymethyldihydropteridine diphosphokinase [Gammaproteobacteria bacterium]|nr:2-amino-4-hydroxy-6-hydroxymethyldihydropteridine diphosphokinase [Gammaproteobacteria bacterium]